ALTDFALAITPADQRDVVASVQHDISAQERFRPSIELVLSIETLSNFGRVGGCFACVTGDCAGSGAVIFCSSLSMRGERPVVQAVSSGSTRSLSLSTFALASWSSLSTRWESWANAPLTSRV